MEIRTLVVQERMTLASLLDGWPLAEGWTAGDRFRQQVQHDPLGATRMFSWLPLRAGSWHGWGGQQTTLRLDPDGSPRGAAEEATEIELMSIGAGNERAASVIRGFADLR